jgi:hypothetical protein
MVGGLAPISCLAYPPLQDNHKGQSKQQSKKAPPVINILTTWLAIQLTNNILPTFLLWTKGLAILHYATQAAATITQTHKPTQTRSTLHHSKLVFVIILLALYVQGAASAPIGGEHLSRVQNAAQIKILNCFLAFQQLKQSGAYASEDEEEHPHTKLNQETNTVRGDPLPTSDHLIICIANASQGLAKYTPWITLLDLADSKHADIMVVSEPGKRATENTLKWGTHHISPGDASTHTKRRLLGTSNMAHMNYLLYATHEQKGDGEGRVVILIHEQWRHKVHYVKRHSLHSLDVFITLSIHTNYYESSYQTQMCQIGAVEPSFCLP